ncbi:ATP synthase subunit I [Halomonas alkaliantarctica]|uniref:ATP synthase subunit I n=1 Tax=Halomonas alkaliantarctica TaxID=232346 RepID=A0ABY8LL37_9GAMM|nr:ATP synthase subunit I [Halomonas alkaliantarctica]WGI24292.1 ATP synthase subunit I [Halomonas alkaliantarctica]
MDHATVGDWPMPGRMDRLEVDERTMMNTLSLPLLSFPQGSLPLLLTWPLLLKIPLCFLGGLALGYIYFYVLQKTINLFVNVSHGRPLMAMALTLGRLTLLVLGLYVAVLMGALTLLAMLTGIVSAKTLMLRKLGHTTP